VKVLEADGVEIIVRRESFVRFLARIFLLFSMKSTIFETCPCSGMSLIFVIIALLINPSRTTYLCVYNLQTDRGLFLHTGRHGGMLYRQTEEQKDASLMTDEKHSQTIPLLLIVYSQIVL
jgi:hypothetical protein